MAHRRILSFLLPLLPLVTSGSSQAALMRYTGSFSASFSPVSYSYEGIPVLSGTWSFILDDSFTPLPGYQEFRSPLASLQLNSIVGSTTFTQINSVFDVIYFNGNLNAVCIGGAPQGADGTSGLDDDFAVSYYPSGNIKAASVNIIGTNYIDSAVSLTGSYTVTPVPEVQTSALFMGGFLLAGTRRKRP